MSASPILNSRASPANGIKASPETVSVPNIVHASKLPANLSEILSSNAIIESDKLIIDYFFRVYKFKNEPSNGGISAAENETNMDQINSLWPSGVEIKQFNYKKSDGIHMTLSLKKDVWKWKMSTYTK